MKESKLPSRAQLENIGDALAQSKTFIETTCGKIIELLENPAKPIDDGLRATLEAIRYDCEHVLKLWED